MIVLSSLARNQLEGEMQKRMKAEQSMDHLVSFNYECWILYSCQNYQIVLTTVAANAFIGTLPNMKSFKIYQSF